MRRFWRPCNINPSDDAKADENGISVVEVMVTLAATSIAAILVFPVVQVVSGISTSIQGLSSASSVSQNLDSDLTITIGSADSTNICFPAAGTSASDSCPASGTTSGNTLRVLTNAYDSCKWEQWSVSATDELQEMSWPVNWSGSPAPAELNLGGPVENSTLTPVPSIFTLDSTGHLLTVTLAIKGTSITGPSTASADGETVVTTTTISLLGSTTAAGSC